MPNLSNKVNISLTLPDESTYIPSVWNEDLVVEITKQKDEVFYRKELSTACKFLQSDYEVLKLIELDPVDRCKKILFELNHNAGNIIQGYISMDDSSPDFYECIIESPVRADHPIDCIEEIWENKVNLLATPFTVSVEPLFGTLFEVQCTGDVTFSASASPDAVVDAVIEQLGEQDPCWQQFPPIQYYTPKLVTSNSIVEAPGGYQGTFNLTLIREDLETGVAPPAAAGWTLGAPGIYHRIPITNENMDSTVRDVDFTDGTFHREWVPNVEVVGESFDNGVRVETTFDMLLEDCPDLTFVSNFLQINQDGTNPSNGPYLEALLKLSNLIIFQKSDIIDADASNNASRSETTLKKYLTLWRDMLQLYPKVEGNIFRLEHISYYDDDTIGLDLTVGDYANQILGKLKYNYDKSEAYEREEFEWMDKVDILGFESRDIRYSEVCSDPGNKLSRKLEATTSLEYVRANPELTSKEGWFIIATEIVGGFKINEQSILGAGYYLNGCLSWKEIHEHYWRHNRLQPEGILNGDDTTFESYVFRRLYEKLEINMSIPDFLAWDYTKKVNTPLGLAEVRKAQYSLNNEVLTLELLF